MQIKDKAIPQFADEVWLSDLGFLADITSHLNDLNKKLQGKDNLGHELFSWVLSSVARNVSDTVSSECVGTSPLRAARAWSAVSSQ